MKKLIENMRDCVKRAFDEGSQRGYEFKKMRHAIIVELKRFGLSLSEIKDELLEWNKRCERVLPSNEQKRQLIDYVDWVNEQQKCWLGCKGLEDFCIGQDKCSFHKQKVFINKKQVEERPFDFDDAEHFLQQRYRGDGYVMYLILMCLRRVQIEKATGETIFIGYRAIANEIRDHYRHMIDYMTVFRRVQDLISEGMIDIVVKGERGTFGRPANGYRFLKWEAPKDQPTTTQLTTTHNNSIV